MKDALEAVFGYTIFNDVTSNGMRAEDLFHYYALYGSKDDPTKTERVEQHLSTRAGTRAADIVRARWGRGVVTRDEVADPDDLRGHLPRGRRNRGRGQHAVLQLQGRRGDRVHQPLSDAGAGGRDFLRDRVQAGSSGAEEHSHSPICARPTGPVEVAIAGLGRLGNRWSLLKCEAPARGSAGPAPRTSAAS